MLEYEIHFQLTCSTEAVRLTGTENVAAHSSLGMQRREMMLINFTIICLTEQRACLGFLLSIYVSHSVATRYTMFLEESNTPGEPEPIANHNLVLFLKAHLCAQPGTK